MGVEGSGCGVCSDQAQCLEASMSIALLLVP